MNKAAVYARVSPQKQQKEETIKSQKDSLLKFARRSGFEIPQEWIFEDDGCSVETMIRPALEKLRDLAPESLFDTIFIVSADRLARNYAHQYILIEEFKKSNVFVKFINTPDQSTPENKLLLQLQGMFAEYERTQIIERCRRGKKYKAMQGKISTVGSAPYGYRYITKSAVCDAYYEVIKRESEVVRLIFNLYSSKGFSFSKIKKELLNRGINSPRGNKEWNRSTLHGIIRNPTYTGTAYFGKYEKCMADQSRLPRKNIRLKGISKSLYTYKYRHGSKTGLFG